MGSAAVAQGFSFAVSLLTSLLVPKVLGVADFGYWQLFIFYFNYVGAFQFGLNDGIYLIKGGQRRKELSKSEVTSQCLVGFAAQTLMALAVIAAIVAMQLEPQRLFVIVACAVLMPLYNLACFFQYLLQAIDETRAYSRSVMVDRGAMLVLLSVLLVFKADSFEVYVYAFCAGKALQLAYLLLWSRDILTTSLLGLEASLSTSWASVRVGIKLMIANLASTLILGMMRFAIDGYWGLEEFSRVSLALSMANFFLTFVMSVTMVLFPTLRQMEGGRLRAFFDAVQNALELMLPAVLLLYLPAKLVLSWWLPDYAESFEYLGLLLPLCLFDGKMSALYSTMFKVQRMEGTLLILNVATMVMSACLATLGALVFHSLDFVLISGTASVVLRSILSGAILSRRMLGSSHFSLGEIVLSAVFICGSLIFESMEAAAVYLVAYALYLFLRRESLRKLLDTAARTKRKFEREADEK